jgi:hypothetical protein
MERSALTSKTIGDALKMHGRRTVTVTDITVATHRPQMRPFHNFAQFFCSSGNPGMQVAGRPLRGYESGAKLGQPDCTITTL